jgi:hypothetical protein
MFTLRRRTHLKSHEPQDNLRERRNEYGNQ